MESSVDLAKKIAETLNWKLVAVEDFFDISEDKKGFFVLALKPKKFMDTADFRAVCALTRDLDGEDGYVKFSRSWKVPSKFVKEKPKEGAPKSSAEPKKESDPIKPGYYSAMPIGLILSPDFSLRLNIETNIKQLMDQIAATISDEEQAVILEPIVCRPATKAGYLEVAAGERRLLAAKKLNLGVVPVVVKTLSDEEFDRIRAMENFAREDLTDYETARLLKYLLDKYPQTYPTQERLAEVFGKTQSWVSHHISLLTTDYVPGHNVESGSLTEKQVRQLHAATPEQREEVLDEANQTGKFPSARRIEQIRGPQTVSCAYCGEPVEKPVHFEGSFYHEDCLEQVKAEKEAGLVPETRTGPFETTEQTEEDAEPEKASKVPTKPEPLLTGYPWTCPDCGAKFIINHVDYPNSDRKEHRLEACGK